tara:strand:- start:2353 stop:2886 length:534 start_codon:yes stop_codon:yes gene_type:complete
MNNGKINMIIGPMYSGKSTTLLTRYNRYKIGKKKCLLVKYKNDNRYDENKVITHDNLGYEAISCIKLQEINKIINKYEIICIDEIQFYSDAAKYCDLWANKGKIIEVCGLNGDYNREPFKQISLLIPLTNDIIFLKAVDEESGDDAIYTKRLVDNKEKELIGGKELYIACSRSNYFI